MHPFASGLIGAATLTGIHQAARYTMADPPRMDVLGMRAIARLFDLAGQRPPAPARLYRMAIAGDLISNALYYSTVQAFGRPGLWRRAVGLGLAAGIGAVTLPDPLGLAGPPHSARPRTNVLTVAWYLAGALAAAAAADFRHHRPIGPSAEYRP